MIRLPCHGARVGVFPTMINKTVAREVQVARVPCTRGLHRGLRGLHRANGTGSEDGSMTDTLAPPHVGHGATRARRPRRRSRGSRTDKAMKVRWFVHWHSRHSVAWGQWHPPCCTGMQIGLALSREIKETSRSCFSVCRLTSKRRDAIIVMGTLKKHRSRRIELDTHYYL